MKKAAYCLLNIVIIISIALPTLNVTGSNIASDLQERPISSSDRSLMNVLNTIYPTLNRSINNSSLFQQDIITPQGFEVNTLPPVPDFSAIPTSGLSPLDVQFTDESTNNPTGWAWYFGDETFSNPWAQLKVNAEWQARHNHTSVVLPDGSVLLMGGKVSNGYKNDVWKSSDNGTTWFQVTESARWDAREGLTSVVLHDGSIVLMGGYNGTYKNDVWRSIDMGVTWTQMTSSASWSSRSGHTSISLPDGSIVVMGGYNGSYKNDVWRSTDMGITWAQVTANAGWSARHYHSSVVFPDSTIVLMGGNDGTSKNDVWQSKNLGANWTQLTSSAKWSARSSHTSTLLSDGSIVLMGGSPLRNDVWRSTDQGSNWTQLTTATGWSARFDHTSVLLPNNSILLMGGYGGGDKNDIWIWETSGSNNQNPLHSYINPGIYTVILRAINTYGNNHIIKMNYVIAQSGPIITSSDNATFTTSVNNIYNITATGCPLPVISYSGELPEGITFKDNNDGSATLSGWPPPGLGGTYPITITANNGIIGETTQSFILTVVNTPVAALSGTPIAGESPLTVRFTDGSLYDPTGWAWYFGDETYTNSWTQMTPSAEYHSRIGLTSIVLSDGSIVLMGGGWSNEYMSDVWRSTDMGSTWTQMTASAEWPARSFHSSMALPDGSIVLMGGRDIDGYKNDVWRSTDKGATWEKMTENAEWPARAYHSSVVLPDSSIVLMGGVDDAGSYNDVWRSTDKGTTWTQMTANAKWSLRWAHTSVVLPDGSIVLMGGTSTTDDVWRSTDQGATWTLMTSSAGWSARYFHTSVVLPDGSILLMGGQGEFTNIKLNDVWRSTDLGATWTQITDYAEWSDRTGLTSVALPDGSIILTGGWNSGVYYNDVWRWETAGSTDQNPSHTYTDLGKYTVKLQAYNSYGHDVTIKNDYISVLINPVITSSDHTVFTILFDNTFTITATGSPLPTLSYSGILPDGITFLDNGNGTATFSGSPFSGTAGVYPLTIIASNGGLVDTTQPFFLYINTRPLAIAGPDQVVDTSATVTLDGSSSNDIDENTQLTYAWTQIGGTSVTLSSTTSAISIFTGPSTSSSLTFSLVVTDNLGTPSAPDYVVVNVSNPPTANAGPDQSVDTLSTVSLNGSLSSDPDGDTPLTYVWMQTSGTSVTLSNASAVSPTFTAPGDPASLTFSLVVTDSLGASSTLDEVVITVNNQAPIANAGRDQSVNKLSTVTLSGTLSSDPDGDTPLTYLWSQTAGTPVTLSSTTSATPTLTAPANPASLIFSLVVTDNLGASSTPDTVIITVNGPPPEANFSASPTSGLLPLEVQFTDGSLNNPAGWAWYFGDETFSNSWTQMTPSAGWSARYDQTSVALPDGSIVNMGGYDGSYKNDVWRSTDQGATWTQMTASAGWSARNGFSSVVLPDGSIVLMGGNSNGSQKNDVWGSTDMGATWTQMTVSAEWSARSTHTSVALPDGSIVLLGGYDGSLKNDVWRSTNKGITWTQMTASAEWSARHHHTSVVLPDGSIVLMGGTAPNDVWRSTDMGATWNQMTASAGWSARAHLSSVALPDGSIVLMGGFDDFGQKNDVWRSTDLGATWMRITASAEWSVRTDPTSVALPDGSIVLMGGNSDSTLKNDVWRWETAGSYDQHPLHTYNRPGLYPVTLQAYNPYGFSYSSKTDYIRVNLPPFANAGPDQSVNTLSTVTLNGSLSSDPDGDTPLTYLWSQTTGTPITLSSSTSPNPTFTAPANPATLTFSLIVIDILGASSAPDEVTITVNNQAPLANAGQDQSVNTLSIVTLNGSASSDPDGDTPLTYAWSQTAGTPVTLSSSTSANPTFTAPADPAALTFSLVVTDSLGASSNPEDVTITVNNQPPAANAGPDQSVNRLSTVTLSGVLSSDPDGDTPLTYHWSQTAGTPVTLSSTTSASPTFTAPGNPTSITFSLVVTDSLSVASTPDTVIISVGNQSPLANAGPDQSVNTLATVTLSGSLCNDPDGDFPLTYAWSQTGGTSVTLSSTSSVSPTFTAPANPATFTFSLVVTDSLSAASTPDTVTITVNNQPPLANAGPDQSVNTLATVTLSGTLSIDPDGDNPLTYLWSQTGGTPVTLSNATSASPTFTAPGNPASLTFSLVVTDSLGASSTPDEVTIIVNNQAPAANAGPDQSVDTLSTVTLDSSASSDPDDDTPLTYLWSQTSGTPVTLSSTTSATPTFTAPANPSSLTFSLVVTDSLGASSTPDEVTIIVNNQAPVANAGPDQAVFIFSNVILDGSSSGDPDGDTPLIYTWTQTGGTSVTLSNATAVSPTFTAPAEPTSLTFSFVVTDSLGASSTPDEVIITIIHPNDEPILTSISSPFVYTYMGDSPFTLHVYGEKFIDSSLIKWNGVGRLDTVFVSETELTVTLTEDDLSVPGAVEISVVTPAPGGGESGSTEFMIVGISPAYDEKLTASKVMFDWGDIPEATAYKIKVSTKPDFSVLLVNIKSLTSEQLYDTILSYNKTYYWKIRPIFGDVKGSWSPVFEFTSMDRLVAPILISPAPKEPVTSSVILQWSSVENAAQYLVVVAKDAAFTIIEKKVKQDPTTAEFTLKVGKYYWRVRAIDEYGAKGPWSEVRIFKVLTE